ncbi:MAG: hypothetical protein EXR92_06610 [Gemmatimonadetes bacterium]|nr:hypothetical protein [Gemmatimonadota bacterium]
MVMRQMRQNTKIIMLATALTFVALMVFQWGMDVSGRSAGTELGRVGGTAVSIEDYNAVYRTIYDRIQQSQETPISSQQDDEIGDQAWTEVVNQVLIRNELARRGIRVSDDEIRQAALYAPPPEFRTEPAFLSETGQFDLQKYQQYLNQAGQDPQFLQQLELYYRDAIPREKLIRQVTSGIFVSDGELWDRWRTRNEQVEVTYLAVTPADRVPDSSVQVPAEEVESYYRDHPDEFAVPARASVRFTHLDKTPTAADQEATTERVRSIRDEIVASGDFAQVAARASADPTAAQTGGAIGTVMRGNSPPELDAVVFSIPIGTVSEPIQTTAGYHLIEVLSRDGDQAEVRQILIPVRRTAESELAMLVLADSLEALGAGRTVAAAAEPLGLEVLEGEITADFAFLLGVGNASEAQDWVFQDQEGVGAVSPVFESPAAFYMVEIVNVSPSGSRPLTEASAQIEWRLRLARKVEQVLAEARGWTDELRSGSTTLEALGNRLSIEPERVGPFTREEFVPGLGQQTAAVGAAFGVAVGQFAGPVVAMDRVILLRVENRVEADRAEWEAQEATQRTQVTQGIQQARLIEWLDGLRETTRIVDNRDTYFQLAEEQAANPTQLPMGPTR